jgi:hypothetical protein
VGSGSVGMGARGRPKESDARVGAALEHLVFAELAPVVARVAAESLDFSVGPIEPDDAAAAFTSEVSAAIAEEVAEREPQLEGASASRKCARVYALPELFPVGFAVWYTSEMDLTARRVAAACCWLSAPGKAGCLHIRCSCAGASAWRVGHAVEAARSITGTPSVAVGGEDCCEMRALRSAMSAAAALAVGVYMECIDGGGGDNAHPGKTAATATRMVLNALANIAIGELEAEGGAVCGSVEVVEPVGRCSGYDPDLIVCLDRPPECTFLSMLESMKEALRRGGHIQVLSPDGARRVVPVRYVLSTSAKVSCFFCSGGAACVHCSATAGAAAVRRRALSSETGLPGDGNAGRRQRQPALALSQRPMPPVPCDAAVHADTKFCAQFGAREAVAITAPTRCTACGAASAAEPTPWERTGVLLCTLGAVPM